MYSFSCNSLWKLYNFLSLRGLRQRLLQYEGLFENFITDLMSLVFIRLSRFYSDFSVLVNNIINILILYWGML